MFELVVRNWRITRGIPGGCHLWFDPSVEAVRLYRIPPSDSDEVGAGSAVDEGGESGYLDKVASVSECGPGLVQGDSDRFEQLSLVKDEDELPF